MSTSNIKVEEVEQSDSAPHEHHAEDTPFDDEEVKEEDDDEDETCGFCKFMKAGGCRQTFIDWSNCVDKERDAGSDFTEECRDKTLALRECMLAHAEYYAPMLEEEEEMAKDS
jgi:mitochondrial intermembrane space import and assembly protein 40